MTDALLHHADTIVARALVTGSRSWPADEWATIFDALDAYATNLDGRLILIHGGAMGPDSWADEWGRSSMKVAEIRVWRPNYDAYGSAAPHLRNDAMLAHANHVIAFWDGKSRGTKSVIKKAQKRGLSYEVHSPAGVYVEV